MMFHVAARTGRKQAGCTSRGPLNFGRAFASGIGWQNFCGVVSSPVTRR